MDSHLSQQIIELENKYNLLELDFKGLQIYPFFRLGLFYELANHLMILTQHNSLTSKNYINNILIYLKHSLFSNDFWGVTPHQVVVIEHPRKQVVNGILKEIYTEDLVKKLPFDICTIKQSNYGKYQRERIEGNHLYYDYFAIKRKVLEKCYYQSKEALIVAEHIKNALKIIYSSNEVLFYINKMIWKAYWGVKIAKSVLLKIKPKLLLIVNSYGFSEFVYAAKQLSIPVVEQQHGIISKYHLGYHFPNSKYNSISTFPDYLLTFGKHWNTAAQYPIKPARVVPVGFHHFESQRNNHELIANKKNKHIFISQKTIGKPLSEFAVKWAEKFSDKHIYFKLHPKQFDSWQEELPALSNNAPDNIQVIGESGPDIYQLFSQCNCQIGVFSTALYEGLGFGLSTVIVRLPGWQYMETLIQYNYAIKFVDSIEQAFGFVETSGTGSINRNYFFTPNAIDNTLLAVDKILSTDKR